MAQLKLDHTLGTLEKSKEKLSQFKLDQAVGALEVTTKERPSQLGLTSATGLEDSLTVRDRRKTAQPRPVPAAEMQTHGTAQQKEEATQYKRSPVTDLEDTKDNKRKFVQTESDDVYMLTSASPTPQKKFSNLNRLSSVEASDNERETDENSQLGFVVSHTSNVLGFGSPKSTIYTTGSPKLKDKITRSPKHRYKIPDSPRSKDNFADLELPHTAAFNDKRNDPKDNYTLLAFSDTAENMNESETENSEKLLKSAQVSPKDYKIKIKDIKVDVERVNLLDPMITLPELGFNTSPFSLDSSTSQKQVPEKCKPTWNPGSKKRTSPNKHTAAIKQDLNQSVSEDSILTRKRNSLDASNTPRKHAKALYQDVIQKLSPKKQITKEKQNLDQSTHQDSISTRKQDLVQMSSDPSFPPKSRHISFSVTKRKRSPRKTACRNYVTWWRNVSRDGVLKLCHVHVLL